MAYGPRRLLGRMAEVDLIIEDEVDLIRQDRQTDKICII